MKNFILAGIALAASSIPATAGATTTIVGDTVQCMTNTSPSSGCNTTTTPPGFSAITNVVTTGVAPEFFINAVPNGGSANPIISANFDNGILTLQGLGGTPRLITATVLTFANLTKPWATAVAGAESVLDGINGGMARVSIQNGLLRVDLRNIRWSEATTAQIAVTAVPEPGTWMLMILGLGAVGFSMRRRQKVTARLQFA